MPRRAFLGTTAAALAGPVAPTIARAQAPSVLTFVPQADPAILDPVVTTGLVSRNHGFLVFDTLSGVDAQFRPQPQMLAGHTIGADGTSSRRHPCSGT